LAELATIVLDVLPGVTSGTVGLQLELACGGVAHFLPSASSLHEMPFTTDWQTAVLPPPAARRRLHPLAPDRPARRQLNADVQGDVNGDGVTNALDLTAVVNYFKAPPDPSALSAMGANQRARGLGSTAEGRPRPPAALPPAWLRSPSGRCIAPLVRSCGSTPIATACTPTRATCCMLRAPSLGRLYTPPLGSSLARSARMVSSR